MHRTVCNTLLRTGVTLVALFSATQLYAKPADVPLDWDDLDGNGSTFNSFFSAGQNAYDLGGNPLRDAEQSSDPTNGGTGVGADIIDIASGLDGTSDAPGNCNPPQLDAVTGEDCGLESSAYYYYFDSGNTPNDITDDYLLLRMRMVGDPSSSAGSDGGWSSQHWNFLVSTETDTVDYNGVALPIGYDYKEYWLDIHGADGTLRVIYENENQQDLTGDPETIGLVMDEFVSCATIGDGLSTAVNLSLIHISEPTRRH